METLKAIHTRHSVRQYITKEVDERHIQEVIGAGMMAPSAGNERPWHFLVLRQRATLQAISNSHPFASMVEKAPVAILVCGDLNLDNYEGYWVQDCAAATQNMLLTAHDLGLGSVWVGLYPRAQRVTEMRSIIKLPDHIIPFAILPLGYPAEIKEEENRFEASRIHWERW
jgi:nitroreductase